MNEEAVNVPVVRSWRDIPQPVRPRAMSRSGRWRRRKETLRAAVVVALAVGLAAGAWWVAGMLRPAPQHVPQGAKAGLVRQLELKTTSGGVLDVAWLQRTLALPRHAALMELNLEKLRARLLADRQVVSATIARRFPDRLVVSVEERAPVARVRVEVGGAARDFLVAPDGVVFAGTGFDSAFLASLPWLGGVTLGPEGEGFRPIAGLAPVAQLLAEAQLSAPRLCRTWLSISLARLAGDRELEVTTTNGTTIVFKATGEFFSQLATLDYLLDRLADTPMARAHIDLTLGRNVPVRIEPAAPEQPPAEPAAAPPAPANPAPASPPFFSP
jgi:cell division protein FtsQ